jgi:hypothetical protein
MRNLRIGQRGSRMTQAQSKQAHALISYYQTKYKAKFGRRAIVNRNILHWSILNILKDLSSKEIMTLMDFYIKTDKNPSLKTFCYDYDEIYERMNLEAKDLEKRKTLLKKTQKDVEDFRRRYGAGK